MLQRLPTVVDQRSLARAFAVVAPAVLVAEDAQAVLQSRVQHNAMAAQRAAARSDDHGCDDDGGVDDAFCDDPNASGIVVRVSSLYRATMRWSGKGVVA